MNKELLWQIYYHSKSLGEFIETLREYLKDDEEISAESGGDPPPPPPPPPPPNP